MHPSESQWLLASNHKNELLLSQDLGSTWKSIANRVFDFAWGRAAGDGWAKDSIIAAILDDNAPVPLSSQYTKSLSLCVYLHPPFTGFLTASQLSFSGLFFQSRASFG